MSISGPIAFAGLVLVAVFLLAPGSDGVVTSASEPHVTALEPAVHASTNSGDKAGNGIVSRELTRDADGRFYAEAQINGARIRLLVDTGASLVALTPGDAQRAGIVPGNDRARAVGAGGEVEIRPVTLDRVAIGPLAAANVRGAVVETLPVSLLGQSYLSRIASVTIEGDRMILR